MSILLTLTRYRVVFCFIFSNLNMLFSSFFLLAHLERIRNTCTAVLELFLGVIKFSPALSRQSFECAEIKRFLNRANKVRKNHMARDVHHKASEHVKLSEMTNRLYRRTSVKETWRNWIRAAWMMTWNNGTHLEFYFLLSPSPPPPPPSLLYG